MTNQLFINLVHKYFDFLVKEYSYSVDKEHQSTDMYDSGYVEFKSFATLVRVEKDGQNILVSIMPVGEPQISKQYLPAILEALSYAKANNYPVIVGPSEYEEVLSINATLLKEYCKDFLKGNFSKWLDVLRFNVEKKKADYFFWSGKELPIETFSKLENYLQSKKHSPLS